MLREIIHFPNPILRKKAKAVKSITPEIQKLLDDMAETMYAAPGVGLAAPQIGVSRRVIVIDVTEDHRGLIVMVNPKIIHKGREKVTTAEGCLSIPGVLGQTPRHTKVTARGLDRKGKLYTLEAEGLLARAFQHEIDHIDGTLYIDRVEDKKTIQYVGRAADS